MAQPLGAATRFTGPKLLRRVLDFQTHWHVFLLTVLGLALAAWGSTNPDLRKQHDRTILQHPHHKPGRDPQASVAPLPHPMRLLNIPADRARL